MLMRVHNLHAALRDFLMWDDFLAAGFQDRNPLVGISRLTSDF
jgi:hypothetical protein